MLRDLIERARSVAPDAFVEEEFLWPPDEISQFDLPYREIEEVALPAGGVVIEGPVSPDPDDALDHPLRRRGLDVVAWYRSYHFGEARWGIYITEAGVRRIAQVVGGDASVAFGILWSHEYFHFLADVAATYVESEAKSPSYLPHYRLREKKPPAPGHDGWCHIAEAVANGYALDVLEVRTGVRRLREWTRKSQPAGYRDGPRYAGSKPGRGGVAAAERGRRDIMWHLLGATAAGSGSLPDPSPSVLELAHWLAIETDVPWYWVSDRGALRPTGVPFIAAATVDTTPGFEKRIAALGLRADWERAREQLARDAQHPGLRFKKLRGSADMFSIRLGRGHRCLLRLRRDGGLVAEGADKRAEVYR